MSRVTHLLIHRTTLERNAPIESSPGRWRDDFQPIAVHVRMRIWAMSGPEALVAQQLRVTASHVTYWEPEQDVKLNDEFDGPAGTPFAPHRYRVVARLPPSKIHHLKTLVEEIQTAKPNA